MDRELEAWEASAARPFLTIGEVSVWSLGNQRFQVQSPLGIDDIEGFEEARRRARELADGG